MALDLAPVAWHHFGIFIAAFIGTYAVIGWLLHLRRPLLKHTTSGSAFFAGVTVVAFITVLALIVVPNRSLVLGMVAAAFIVLFVGSLDESRSLKPASQLFWQVVVAAIVVSVGWRITAVSALQGGGVLHVDQLGWWLSVVWLVVLMNAINWLDGVDGLASGVGWVAFGALGLITLLPSIQDGNTLSLALVGMGTLLGFWLWNFAPARVHLGTSGSWFVGLFLGMTAIVGGGKIATTVLVLALPLLDVLFVIIERLRVGRLPWQGDRAAHLHYKLIARGVSPRVVAISGMIITAFMGWAALELETQGKMAVLGAVGAILGVVSLRFLTPLWGKS